jgi:hypothetical protein
MRRVHAEYTYRRGRVVTNVIGVMPFHIFLSNIQSDSELLSEFPWPINRNSGNNLESLCI